jgi:hypothetical protein
MINYLEELDNTGNSLMIYKADKLVFESQSKGIRPYLEAINSVKEGLNGTTVVDKIVGRAAALLIVYIEAEKVFASVLSRPGKEVLDQHGFNVVFSNLVDQIKLKDGRIFCPFERMVQGISDPRIAYVEILKKMKEFKS